MPNQRPLRSEQSGPDIDHFTELRDLENILNLLNPSGGIRNLDLDSVDATGNGWHQAAGNANGIPVHAIHDSPNSSILRAYASDEDMSVSRCQIIDRPDSDVA